MSINYSVYLICSRGWQDSNLRPSDSLLCQLSYIRAHKQDDCFHPNGSYRE